MRIADAEVASTRAATITLRVFTRVPFLPARRMVGDGRSNRVYGVVAATCKQKELPCDSAMRSATPSCRAVRRARWSGEQTHDRSRILATAPREAEMLAA